jgi:hypothetical protein
MNPDGVALVITALVPLVAAVASALGAWRRRSSCFSVADKPVLQGDELEEPVANGL